LSQNFSCENPNQMWQVYIKSRVALFFEVLKQLSMQQLDQ
jgi:hypothetical protein